ncbi:MAG TPA: threonine/serine dehydratase [Streptosporangiaceae bacterium]|nr:threonine/serine dehydratase [Streptosporangiaceae bacterium]
MTADEIKAAAARLQGVTVDTPLLPLPLTRPRLLLKPESLQPTGSFKLRGAYAAITALPRPVRARGVVAHSSGNHAYALAHAASLLGIPAAVVVPRNAPEVKVIPARRLGAQVVACEPTLAARVAATQELASHYGYTVIPPFDHPAVIAGQGTVGLEIATAFPAADLVLVPVGGGGLISGVATAISALCPQATVIGVEPELAADACDSLAQGVPVQWPSELTSRTLADALRVEQVGELPLQHMRKYVAGIVTVTEGEICEAVRQVAYQARLIAEPGGAVAVAAWLFHRAELPAAKAPVAVLSGGNIDPVLLAGIMGAPTPAEAGPGAPPSRWMGH